MVHTNVRPFVHLRTQSTYSLGVGLSSPGDICAQASRVGYRSVALTDINGTYGFIEFHHAARSLGIKPIYGTLVVVDWLVGNEAPADERHLLTLLALDRSGLRNVCDAASVSASRRERGEGFHVADIDRLGEGVACIVGLPSTVTAVLPRSSREVLTLLRAVFGDRLFVEALVKVPPIQAESRAQLDALAADLGVAPVLCQDVRFVGQEKHQLIDLIGSGEDPGFDHSVHSDTNPDSNVGFHGMYSPDEMSAFFEQHNEAYTNASLIASLVQPDILDALGTSDPSVTSTPTFADHSEVKRAFDERVYSAFDREFADVEGQERAGWVARLKDELEIIHGTELEDTFLQFQEIAARARGAGALMGPASGLRLQSLCAYLLGITSFNPYNVDACFQPFFDERERANRVLDLQISAGAHSSTVEGLSELFDSAGIGYVPSVEHITASRALKMVARRLAKKEPELNEVLRAASGSPGATLQELCTENRRLGWLYKRSAWVRELISHAASIEGLPYGFVRSKRTLIISPTPLREFLGHTVNRDTGDRFVQSTRDSFPIGSISRVDVSTLNALAVCARLGVTGPNGDGADWHQGRRYRDIYRMIQHGDVAGVFLLESELITRLARSFEIGSFDDLLCFLALMRFRRGGMSLADRVEAYRDPNREAAPTPDAIAHLLAFTNGWALFDDQLRDIVGVVTGLDPLNAAQMVRRFARQEPGELASLRREFMTFAVEFGTEMEVANASFARVLRAAGGTVSRQQIIAEALIVSTMLYLKKRESIRYFAELVNVYRDSEAKRSAYLERLEQEARVLAPDINESGEGFLVQGRRVQSPLWIIDGITARDATAIRRITSKHKVVNRNGFESLVGDAGITHKVAEALVRAGALESIGMSADEILEPPVPDVVAEALPQPEADRGQLAFELEPGQSSTEPPSTESSPATQNTGNKGGRYVVLSSLAEFHPHAIATAVELAGRISDLRTFKSSSGETIGFFMLGDSTASVPVFVPWDRVGQPGEPLDEGDHVLVRGTIRMREGMKTCEAAEVSAGGEIDNGKTTPNEPTD